MLDAVDQYRQNKPIAGAGAGTSNGNRSTQAAPSEQKQLFDRRPVNWFGGSPNAARRNAWPQKSPSRRNRNRAVRIRYRQNDDREAVRFSRLGHKPLSRCRQRPESSSQPAALHQCETPCPAFCSHAQQRGLSAERIGSSRQQEEQCRPLSRHRAGRKGTCEVLPYNGRADLPLKVRHQDGGAAHGFRTG